MTNKKRVLIGGILLLVLGGAFLQWFQWRTEYANFDNFSHLTAMPGGRLLAPIGKDLLVIDTDGQQQVLELPAMGLPEGITSRAAGLNADEFLVLVPGDDSSVIKRCSIRARICRKQARVADAPERASRLYYFPTVERLLLVDNGGDRLLWLDMDGKVLQSRSGFEFPNGVWVTQQGFYLVDTNHHVVDYFDVTQKGFTGPERSIHIPREGSLKWPVEVFSTGDGWLVQEAQDAMKRDGFLVFTSDWKQPSLAAQPSGRDLMSSTVANDALWVATDDRKLYWSVAPYTALQPLVAGPAADYLDRVAVQAAQLKQRATIMLMVCIVLFVLAFALAWKLDGKTYMDNLERQRRAALGAQPAPARASGHFIEIPPGRLMKYRYLIMAMPLVMLGLMLINLGNGEESLIMVVALVMMIVISVPLLLLFQEVAGTRLFVDGDRVRVECARGGFYEAGPGELKASAGSLLVAGKLVFLGQPQQRLYDNDAVQEHLNPLLGRAEKLTPGEYWRSLMLPQNKAFKAIVAALAVVFVCLAAVGLWFQLKGIA